MKMKHCSSVFFIMVLLSVSQAIDASSIDLNETCSDLADVVAHVSSWDEDQNSVVWQLKGYLDAGNTIIDKDALVEALVYAESMIEKKSAQLPPDQLTHVSDVLSMLADVINNEDDADRSGKIIIKRKVNFLKDVKFKDKASFDHFVGFHGNVKLRKNAEVDCNLTVGCNLSLSDSISQNIGNVVKNGNPFISTYPGSASQNTFVGEYAGNFSMTGTQNSAFGNSALYSNTTGYSNIAIGPNALAAAPGSYENIAIGSGAMQFAIALDPVNSPASSNIAIGTNALQNTNSGTDDTDLFQSSIAIGSFALQNNTTGFQNVAIGQYAMQLNTIGYRNIAIGTNALASNTIGLLNTAVGDYALSFNTTGSSNVAFGTDALNFNTTGQSNTAVGYQALYNNITGSNNIGIGLDCFASGDDNVIIGYYAGNSGSQNIGIGSQALYNIGSDQNVAIGYQAMYSSSSANGSNTAVGYQALYNAQGASNIAIGAGAGGGSTLDTSNNNIYIANNGADESGAIRIGTNGTQTSAFIAGLYGSTVDPVTGILAYVDVNGQLGTVVSSRRFKHDINSMNDESELIYQLNPVTFAYNSDVSETKQYGLIAEEVDQVFPGIVVKDEDGNPYTVQYQVLPVLLLNEVQKQRAIIEKQGADFSSAIENINNRLIAIEQHN